MNDPDTWFRNGFVLKIKLSRNWGDKLASGFWKLPVNQPKNGRSFSMVAVRNRPVVGYIKSSLSRSIILEIKSSFTRIWLSLKRVWSISPIITNITKHWLVRISTSRSTEIRNRRRTTICSFRCSWRSALRSCQRRTLNWIYIYPAVRVQRTN